MGGGLVAALALAIILSFFLVLLLDLSCPMLFRRSGPPDLQSVQPRRGSVEEDAPPPSLSPGKSSARFPFPFYAHGVLRAPAKFLLTIPKLEAMLPPEDKSAPASPYLNTADRFVCISNPVYDGASCDGGDGGGETAFVTPEASPSSLASAEEEEEEEGKRSPPLALMKKLPCVVPAVGSVDGWRSLATSASVTETNRASFSSQSRCSSPSW